jgi:hypothetical protein
MFFSLGKRRGKSMKGYSLICRATLTQEGGCLPANYRIYRKSNSIGIGEGSI